MYTHSFFKNFPWVLRVQLIGIWRFKSSKKKKRNSFSISEGRGFDSHRGQKIFSLPRVVPCFPLLGLTPSGLFMGLSSTIIYTSELILCSTICVPSATRHSIQRIDRPLSCRNQENPVTPNNKFELKEICLVRSSTFGTALHRCRDYVNPK